MRKLGPLLAVVLVLSASTVFADTISQEVTADGSGDYLWNTVDNWTNGVPALANRANIAAGTAIVIKGTADTHFNGSLASGGIEGNLTVDAGATLVVGPAGSNNYQDVYLNTGTLTVKGTMDIGSGNRDRQIYLNGSTLKVDGGTIQETAAAGRWGIFTDRATAGTVDLIGNYFVTIGDEVDLTNGTIKFSGDIASLGTFQVHKLTANATTTFDLSGLTGMAQSDTVTLITNGALTSMANFLYEDSSAAQSWTVGDWEFNFSGGNGGVVPADSYNLTATYLVPEPATMVLLGLGSIAALIRKRR